MRGNLFVGHALGQQGQYFEFAFSERFIQRVMLRSKRACCTMLAHMPQQFRSYDWLKQRSTLHRDTDSVEDVFSRSSLEQVAIGSGFQSGDDAFIVVECGEDDNARAESLSKTRVQAQVLAQSANGFNAVHDRHFEVEQEDIGLQLHR